MKRRLRILFVITLVAAAAHGRSPSDVLRGRVLSETLEPLPHAAVRLENTQHHSISDIDGWFTFRSLAPGVYTVIVSYIGYETQAIEVAVPAEEEVVFYMVPSRTMLEDVVIEGAVSSRSATQMTMLFEAEDLDAMHGKPLGESLKEIPGVSALQTGPAIFKPVIDGLHSQRILILNNGIRQEGQQWGSEHAPEIDPFIASRIEVVKGAEAVRYGSAAMGGVIIISPPRLHQARKIGGELSVGLMSNNRMGVVSGMLEGSVTPGTQWSWRLQGSGKRGGDYHAPKYNLSNTGVAEYNFSGAIGYQDERRDLEVYVSSFNNEIGILRASHTGNLRDLEESITSDRPWYVDRFTYDITHPKQQTNHHLLKVSAHQDVERLGKVSLIYGGQYDLRREYDIRRGGREARPSLSMNLISHVLDLSLDHQRQAHTGSVGINATFKNNTNDTERTGVRPLLPDFRQAKAGVFFHEKLSKDKWTFEAGARYDFQYLQVLTFTNNTLIKPDFSFNYLSATLGAAVLIRPDLRLLSNFGVSSRPPHVSELFSEGLHHGTASVEEGLMVRGGRLNTDPSAIDTELSKKWVSSLQYTSGKLSMDVSAYYNGFDNYVYMRPAGTRLTVRGYFPVFQYEQTDAVLMGTDWAVQWNIAEPLLLTSKFSYVYAKDRGNDDVMLFIPPAQWDTGVTYQWESLGSLQDCYIGISLPVTFRQHRAPEAVAIEDLGVAVPDKVVDLAPAPAGYMLLNARAGFKIPIGEHTLGVTLSGENLLNKTYRNYMNRLRYFADDVGSNFIVRVSYNFLSH